MVRFRQQIKAACRRLQDIKADILGGVGIRKTKGVVDITDQVQQENQQESNHKQEENLLAH